MKLLDAQAALAASPNVSDRFLARHRAYALGRFADGYTIRPIVAQIGREFFPGTVHDPGGIDLEIEMNKAFETPACAAAMAHVIAQDIAGIKHRKGY